MWFGLGAILAIVAFVAVMAYLEGGPGRTRRAFERMEKEIRELPTKVWSKK